MDEAKRFLRYVIPGLAFVIEVIFLLSLARFEEVRRVLNALLDRQSVGAPLSLFIGSGGIGYLFSAVHHVRLWWPRSCAYKKYAFDHREMVERARKWRHLTIRIYGEQGETEKKLTARGAWRVVTGVWKTRVKLSPRIESADRRSDSLTDLAHGSGAAFIGSISALLAWALIDLWLSGWTVLTPIPDLARLWPHFLAGLAALFLVVVHLLAFRQIIEHTKGFIELVLAAELNEHYWKSGPLDVFVFPRDLQENGST